MGRENLTEKHWIYYPEDTVFHRIFVQGNASPHCNPPGGFGLTCEITYSEHKPLPCEGDALIQRCIEDCHKVGFFKPEDPVWTAIQCDLPYAYVVYDHGRAKIVAGIREQPRSSLEPPQVRGEVRRSVPLPNHPGATVRSYRSFR